MTPAELIAAVRTHARQNYNTGGWDYVVEAYDDADLLEFIGKAKTVRGAIRNVAAIVKIHNERREEAQSFAREFGEENQ